MILDRHGVRATSPSIGRDAEEQPTLLREVAAAARDRQTTCSHVSMRQGRDDSRRAIEGGDAMLLHDGSHIAMGYDRSRSVQATQRILDRWEERDGFGFVTVPETVERTGLVEP